MRVALQRRLKIAIQREPRHLCAVSVVVVGSPTGITGVSVGNRERLLQQGMAAIDPGVENARCRRFRTRGRRSVEKVLDPGRLVCRRQALEEGCQRAHTAKLGDVVHDIERQS